VRRVLVENNRATGVLVAIGGIERTIRAERVIVAAGSLRTPAMLARSGIASSHLGKHLHVHPTTAILAGFEDLVETWRGPMQSALSDQFSELEDAYGITFEVVPAHPGLSALSIPWRTRDDHAELMQSTRYNAALIGVLRDRDEGSAPTTETGAIRYRLSDYDRRHLKLGLGKLAELAVAAGASRVQTLHTRPIAIGNPRAGRPKSNVTSITSKDNTIIEQVGSLEAFTRAVESRDLGPNHIALFSAHQMCTARMHANPKDGVVDEYGRVHGIENLIVADASVFPLASGVNPMLTIMAMARRSAAHIVSR
jgi:choline dehydrogenase-like flavoprotein